MIDSPGPVPPLAESIIYGARRDSEEAERTR
jgi:hypothetical protein